MAPGQKGSIYVVVDPGHRWVKVGFTTKRASVRCAQLSQSWPYDLTLYREVWGTWEQEQEVHRRMKSASACVREWYRNTASTWALLQHHFKAALGHDLTRQDHELGDYLTQATTTHHMPHRHQQKQPDGPSS